MSRTEAGFYIKKQIYLMQMNPGQATSPMELNRWIAVMLEKYPHFYQLYFLRFVNFLRLQDLASAETALYDYFDWAVVYSSSGLINVDASNSLACYAPLLLSKLYRHFGFRDKSYDFLQESIQKAQEVANDVCLRHDMTELCILQDTDKTEKPEGLSLFDLWVERKHKSLFPELYFFSSMAKIYSDYRRGKNVKSIIESLYALLSNVISKDAVQWAFRNEATSFAISSLSSLFLETGHYMQCSLEALKVLYTVQDEYLPFCGIACESVCIALCNIIFCLHAKGDTTAAMQLLKYAKSEFPCYLAVSATWKRCEASIGFEVAFLQGQFDLCKNWLSKLMAISPNEALIRKSALQIANRNVKDAMTLLGKLVEKTQSPSFHCR
ncbi:unnamed protein product [Soboliphyme baturini]|uniref:Anaphase-promoting complex subunit 5 n=1 Tax=Soboliphyme baturini TaxID=241478 RepID=A0A183ISK4_9BILA|nr:unnamed protein product [Soboliphyme baturini]